ncbi:MAG: class I SAM-dependent rRNA methyltransferase [Lachnospiraceae bacterium]|nr:class I SAM-dependent rRNA methyltransferase [Lachnospiraceae bacterium]
MRADTEIKARVTLKKGEGRTLSAGGCWVFDNEIDAVIGTVKPGDFVAVYAFNDYPLGVGFINPNSKIRIRVMSRKIEDIDENFLRSRIAKAIDYRIKTVDVSSCRLIFGDADFFPGLTVDKFEDVLVIQALSFGMDRLKLDIVDILKEELNKRGFSIRGVYERSDAKERKKEGLATVTGFIGEEFDTKVLITENTVKYYVDIAEGQKTGFFLDQKYNRRAIWPMAKGAKVLDCFTHTGSFALNAAMAGAASVLGVDASQLAVDQATENAALNGLQDTATFKCADVFELLPALETAGEQFDLVILDPPAFTKSRESVKNAIKGYREINMRGLKLVKEGGYLATCSCSHFMTRELFEKMMTEAAKATKKRLKMVEARNQAPDHPILWGAQESYYLKFYIFQILDD